MSNLSKYLNERRQGGKNSSTTIENDKIDVITKYKANKAKRIVGLDTLQSDLSSMGKTIEGIYGGWQTPETMKNTKSSVESMQKRINAYQEYQKVYGGADISDIASGYKTVLDEWGDRAKTYGKYKDADSYTKAMKAAEESLKIEESKKTANLDDVQKEIDSLEEILNKATEYETKIQGLKNKTNAWNRRANGFQTNTGYDADIKATKSEYNQFLKDSGYKNTEELKKSISDKKMYKNTAKVIQDTINFEKIREDADFEKYVAKGEALGNQKREGWLVPDNQRKNTVAYLRNNPDAMETFEESAKGGGQTVNRLITQGSPEYKLAKYGTNDQVNTYYAYLGKGDEESAEKYLNVIEESLNREMGTAIASEKDGTIEKLMYGLTAGLDQFEQGTRNLFNTSDEYIPSSPTQFASGQIRESLYDVGPEFLGSSLGQGAYDLITTTTNMTPSILASTASNFILPGSGAYVGATLMGASAAGNAYQEMLNMGYDKSQARTYSTLIGVSEAGLGAAFGGISSLGGKLSGKTITAIANGVDNALGRFAITMGGKMVSEGLEEAAQEILSPFFQNIALGYSKYDMSDVEWEQVAYSGVLGALSAGFLEGVGTGKSTFGENHNAKGIGANIRSNEKIGEMLDISSLTPQESSPYDLYTKYANKGVNADNVSDLQLGRLFLNTEADARNTLGSKKSTLSQKEQAIETQSRLSEINAENALDKNTINEIDEGIQYTKTYRDNLISTGLESAENTESHRLAVELQEKLKNGEDISSKDIANLVKANENAIKLEEYAQTMSEDESVTFIEQYDGKMDVEEYRAKFNYINVLADNSIDIDEVLEKSGSLTPSQVSEIYKARILSSDVKPLQTALDNLKAKNKNSVFIEGSVTDVVIDYKNGTTDGSKVNWKDLSSNQKKAIRFAKAFAKATGVNIVFTRSKVVNGKHKGKNGSYDPENNTITLDVFAGRIDANSAKDALIPTMSHELTHWMKQKAPAIYKAISTEVMQTLVSSGKYSMDELIDNEKIRIRKNHKKEVSNEYAMDEIVARACEDMLSNSNQARKILAKMSKEEQQSFKEKVKETFENLIGWVNELLNYYKSESDEAKTLREYKTELKKISKMWDEMLVSSIEANQALQKEGITGEKLARSVSKSENKTDDVQFCERTNAPNEFNPNGLTLEEQLKEALNTAVSKEGRYVYIGKFTEKFTDMLKEYIVLKNYPIVMNYRDAYISMESKENGKYKGKNINYHNLGLKGLESALQSFDTPEYVLLSTNESKIELILSGKDYKNRQLFSIVEVNTEAHNNKGFLKAHVVTSVYGNRGINNRITKAQEEDRLIYNKNEELSQGIPPVQYQGNINDNSSSQGSISQNDTKSQVQNSDRDNLRNTLTEGQAEYFKDSKMRDENGNLLVMYRGDMNEFTVFDRKKSKYGNLYGRGFYFTKVKGHAEQYGKAKEYYLNIKNPLSPKQNNITKKQMLNFLKAIENYGEDYDLYNYGMDATAESVLSSVWGKGDFEMIQDINAGAIGDLVAAIELFNEVNGTTYDGIILPSETVTFKSAQSKLTSNENPTDDEDIRYSDRDYSYETIVAKPDMKLTIVDGNVPNNRADIVMIAKKNAIKVGNFSAKNNTVSVYVDDIGRDIIIGSNGLRHGLKRSKDLQTDENSIVTLKAGEIIKNSIRINELTPKIQNADESYVLIGAAKSADGNLYIVESVINRFSNELMSMDVLYSVNTKKENRLRSMRPGILPPVTDSTISISELLDYVNKYFPDVLPESILRHYGYDARPDGGLGQDALFSDRETESIYDKMGETDRLVKENEKLKEDISRLKERLKLEKQITHGKYFNENHLNAVAGHLRKIASSTYSKENLISQLKDVYSYIVQSENLVWDNLFAKCYEVAQNILSEAKPITETDDYAKSILRDIRSKRISLSESQKQEARYIFGKNYRNSFMGKVMITNDGISLDTQWQEWSQLYPEYFDDSISEADQINALYDIYDDLKDVSEMVVEYDTEEQTRWLATEIYNQYWNVSPIRTTADKYDKKIKLLNFEHRKAMQELRTSFNERLDKKLKAQKTADRQRTKELVDKLRERKDREIAEVKQHSKERMDKYKENAERKTVIQSITANALTLNKWLTKNSKDYHIHEALKEPVINLLQSIDFSSKRLLDKGEPTQKDISLSKALRKVKDMMVDASNGHNDLVELYGHKWNDELKELVDDVDDAMRKVGDNEFVLNQMTLEQLKILNGVVGTIKSAVSKMNKFHVVNHAQGVANLSQETMLYLDSLGKEKIYTGLRGGAKKLLNWGNALPYYVFKRYGNGGKKVFESFQDGWDKFAFHIKEIMDYANEAYSSKEVKEWTNDIRTFKIVEPATEFDMLDPNYKKKYQKIQMTIPQIMSLYCLQKREQAVSHILGGGLRIADIKAKKGEVISQTDGVVLTIKDIATIIDSLTDKQKLIADKLQRFMNTTCTDWGNEVSMLRFGYKAFGEENYFPIQSDKNNLAVNDETEQNNSLFKLLNMSFTKSTIEKANNRIIISDIFDVFAQHTSDMAKYNALALPVLDAFKWYNYTEKDYKGDEAFKTMGVKQSIESAFGKDGQNYFTTFLKDINGQQEVSRDTLGKHFFTNAKIASVGMNIRVALLQPTSYLRASAVIDNRYLTMALAHKPKIKMAEKYCGMALWKSLGYYDTNIQKGVEEQIKHDTNWKDKVVEISMKGAEWGDKLTWGYLWNACELEVRRTRKDLKVGSKEFYDTIGKRLREIIYATQVVDSTMTRSQMMRSSQMYDKMLTAFASEPTLAYNMLQDAYMETKLDSKRMGKKETFKKNGKKIARVLTAYTATNAIAALVESTFDVLRDDEDEEMDIAEFVKIYLGNFAVDMSITAKIPYIKEFVSIAQGFTTSRTDTQWMQSFGYALQGIMKLAQGKGNAHTTLKNLIRTSSYLSGLPFYNAYRDTMVTLNKLHILTTEEMEEILDDIWG